MSSLSQLQKSIGITFTNLSLLENAFIHRSYLNETKTQDLKSNERLEFLGDAVLELATSQFLFHTFPQKPEGELTNLRSSLVKTETLAELAKDLNLGDYLKMSRGEAQSGGRTNLSLLANTVEALIGAMYLDQGFGQIQVFTQRHLFSRLDRILKHGLYRDFKSTLQEKVQARGLPTPTYHVTSEVGPDHLKTFTVKVNVNGTSLGQGNGSSKQQAEQAAAKAGLEKLDQK